MEKKTSNAAGFTLLELIVVVVVVIILILMLIFMSQK